MRSAPQSRLCTVISLIKLIVSGESLGFPACACDLRFQNIRKSSRWKPQQRLWLDKEKRLFPGPNHAGQKHQEKPVSLPADGLFDVSTKDDQLVSSQGVFREQFGFASGQIGECSEHKRDRSWFDPTRNTLLEGVKAETDALLA